MQHQPGQSVAVFAGLLLAIGWPSTALAENPRPKAPLSIERIIETDRTATSSVVRATEGTAATIQDAGSIKALKAGLDAVSKNDYIHARKIRASMPEKSLDHRLLAWVIAQTGHDDITSNEIATAARLTPNWPGAARLRANSERALARENPSAKSVLAAFASSQPQTVEGTMVLARALVARGARTKARTLLEPFWRETKLDTAEERAILAEFGGLIRKSVHRQRMERMLYENRVRSAERVRSLAGAVALHKAWSAVIRNKKIAGVLLDRVPAAQRGAGHAFAKARYLRRHNKFRAAAKIMRKARYSHSETIDPAEWWFERRVLSRELLDQGDAKLAYQVAASHNAQSDRDVADAEFHAGWYALRALNNPDLAAGHFARIVEVADGAISKARGYYWLGRAAKQGGPGKSRDFYEKAARFPTAFYGQVAAAHLGRKSLPVTFPKPSQLDRARFAALEEVHAIRRLQAAGHGDRARAFYFGLARTLDDPGQLALLAVMAENEGDHHVALKVGKIAAARGIEVGALAHPLGAIPEKANIASSKKALAYAIARQESEFNAGAVSHAGARGLLQLMPATARQMARAKGLRYSKARLTSDAAFNAILGTTYLDRQLERFDGSYILTFAGYNAGPARASDWIGRYGDPRRKRLETVVDWIERIPFTETRNYVQRVMENFQVYKLRLTGRLDIAEDMRR